MSALAASKSNDTPIQTVISVACASRIIVWVFSYITQKIIRDYDSSSDLLFPAEASESTIFNTLGQIIKWDAIYFVGIAENGYRCEQYFAFMPGFPILIKYGAMGFHALSAGGLGWGDCFVLSGFVITNISFVCSAVALFWLSSLVTKDSKEALLVVVLYCLSPANVFLSAIYTESMFCLFSFLGFYYYISGSLWKAASLFFLSTCVRSNAVLYIGFIAWHGLVTVLQISLTRSASLKKVLTVVGGTCAQAFLVAMPYLAFQYYGYRVHCTQGRLSEFCNNTLPHIYSYVQSHYWNQGFFKYWQIKQLPNFLIAAPTVFITILGSFSYFGKTWKLIRGHPNFIVEWLAKPATEAGFLQQNPKNFVMTAYWFCFMVLCLFNFHVQTITRFFTSVPSYYWFTSSMVANNDSKSKLLLFYFLMYNIIGITLFSNFYPWT